MLRPKFGIPSKIIKEQVQAEFELYYQQLLLSTPCSIEKAQECKAALSEITHRFPSRSDKSGYPVTREHLDAIKELKRNKDLVITRPDKGNGVVIIARKDYVEKMKPILDDRTKFDQIGDADQHDKTLQQVRALQAFLLRAYKSKHLTKEVYN